MPNYARIGRHFSWPGTPEQMQEANPNGFCIEIEWWHTEEQILAIENGLKSITQKYDLIDYNDDLLLLVLTKYKDVNTAIVELEDEYRYRSRVKELATLLLMTSQTQQSKFTRLQVTSTFDSAKITNADTITWITKLISDSIEKGSYLVSLFGLAAEDMLIDKSNDGYSITIEKLKAASNASLISPTKVIKEQKADLCLFIHKYLITETNIKPEPNTWFSDKLLNFYFDLLELFEYVQRLSIESEPKDYTRTLLWNRIKQLNPSLSRK